MILSKKLITKVLISLHGCAGWSAPVLFANPQRQFFSRCGPYHTGRIVYVMLVHFKSISNDIMIKLEDLKVLRRSPDLLNNVKIGQGQPQLIMEQILFYHIWGLQPFWSSALNNLMNNPSNSPVISEKKMFR